MALQFKGGKAMITEGPNGMRLDRWMNTQVANMQKALGDLQRAQADWLQLSSGLPQDATGPVRQVGLDLNASIKSLQLSISELKEVRSANNIR
jgi:hypothetical protein